MLKCNNSDVRKNPVYLVLNFSVCVFFPNRHFYPPKPRKNWVRKLVRREKQSQKPQKPVRREVHSARHRIRDGVVYCYSVHLISTIYTPRNHATRLWSLEKSISPIRRFGLIQINGRLSSFKPPKNPIFIAWT
jgi:hypothetical protein